VRAVKDSPHPIQGNADPRALALGEFRTGCFQHGFNVSPRDVRPDGIGENRPQCVSVLLAHGLYNGIIE
jgi:hypothetical protein